MSTSERRLVLTPASAITPEPVTWAWEDDSCGRIPAGSFGLFAGREGTGKSSFLIWMAAKVTRGELPGAFKGQPRAVLYLAVEDSWKFTIVPRLMAVGADLDLVYRVNVHTIDEEQVSLTLPLDNQRLEDAVREHGVALLALDPLMSAISDRLDTHVNREVRSAIEPLARLADRTGAVVGGIAHFSKSSSTDASSLITGSGAFKDVARFIFTFAVDPDTGEQVITQTKNSLGRSDLPSLAYRIISAIVPTPKGDANVGRLVIDGTSERTVGEILSANGRNSDSDERGGLDKATQFLRFKLADGPQPTADVEDVARNGWLLSIRTLNRARAEMSIASAKIGKVWWLALPEHNDRLLALKSANSANSTKKEKLATLAELTPDRPRHRSVRILP